MHAALPGGSGQWKCYNALPPSLWAVGGGVAAMHGHNACGQWALKLLQCTATVPGAVGDGTPTMHCHSTCGAWAMATLQCTSTLPAGPWGVELLQCTSTLLGGSGRRKVCNALPHCLGAVDKGPL